jgi:chorismate mutase/prephenate dehydratase
MDLNKDIGSIDLAILDLVAKRIALLKRKMAEEADVPQSWSLASHCGDSLRHSIDASDPALRGLAERIVPFLAGVSYQTAFEPVRIAYLGPEFSYSYSAARKYFGATDGFQAVQTIGAVFEEIEQGHSTYGVVPIENSTDGRIVDTLTMFIRRPVRICGEVLLPIHHNLLAKCDRSEIKEVYSKPQALSQCRVWLAEHLPNAQWVEVASTALAAQIATRTAGAAAVASRDAGIALGLDLVAESIEDNKNNITRFAIIGGDEPKPTTNDKTSLMFQVPHKPGALADVMLLFRDNGLNLTWIESFPVPGVANEYFFFVELDGHRTQPNVENAIRSLEQSAIRLNFLGSYPKGRFVE